LEHAVLICAIESATDRVGCALGDGGVVRACFEVTGARRHAETLVPAIDAACNAAGVTLDDVGCIAVDVGPGLFTGLRVGLATAKSLAHALDLPMVAVSSLEILAQPMRIAGRLIAAVIDARRGEVYWHLYRPDGTGLVPLGEARCGPPDELLDDLRVSNEPVVLVGDGALRHRDALADLADASWAGELFAHPSAATLVGLAHERRLRGEVTDAISLAPTYLRAPDAQINWAVRDGAARDGVALGDAAGGAATDVLGRRAG
jgi:tRNA threonylcarbamoyladenosine biosynthesis protein TsaB